MKFIIGSKVMVNGYMGTVIDFRYTSLGVGFKEEYRVEFNQPNIIGNRDWYDEGGIVSALLGGTEERCPVCGNVYIHSKSPVLNTDWFDCPRCKLTKEKIEETLKKRSL